MFNALILLAAQILPEPLGGRHMRIQSSDSCEAHACAESVVSGIRFAYFLFIEISEPHEIRGFAL